MHSLAENPPSSDAALFEALKDSLRCLNELHKAGFCHNNLKIESLVQTEDGKATLDNFEQATRSSAAFRNLSRSYIHYMAPETVQAIYVKK